MKLANLFTWVGRILGIIQLVFFTGVLIFFATLIKPVSEETAPAILMVMVSVFFITLFGVFLAVAWRRPRLGGVLYLIFCSIIVILMFIFPKYRLGRLDVIVLLPAFLTGALLLNGGLLKPKVIKTS